MKIRDRNFSNYTVPDTEKNFGGPTDLAKKFARIDGFVYRYLAPPYQKNGGSCQKFWNERPSGTKILICGDGFHSFFSLLRVITILKKHIDTFRTVNSCDRDHSKWVKYLLTYFVFQLNTLKNLAKALAGCGPFENWYVRASEFRGYLFTGNAW